MQTMACLFHLKKNHELKTYFRYVVNDQGKKKNEPTFLSDCFDLLLKCRYKLRQSWQRSRVHTQNIKNEDIYNTKSITKTAKDIKNDKKLKYELNLNKNKVHSIKTKMYSVCLDKNL